MNANQQYRLDQLHREDVLRAAHRQQLIHKAVSQSPKSKVAYRAALATLLASLFR